MEKIYAVKYTNAKLGSDLEFDPDQVAACVDVFCYSGEIKYVKITGHYRYTIQEFAEIWEMKMEKSLEEERLLHYYPAIMNAKVLREKEMRLREQSVFAPGELRDPMSKFHPRRSRLTRNQKGKASIIEDSHLMEKMKIDSDKLHGDDFKRPLVVAKRHSKLLGRGSSPDSFENDKGKKLDPDKKICFSDGMEKSEISFINDVLANENDDYLLQKPVKKKTDVSKADIKILDNEKKEEMESTASGSNGVKFRPKPNHDNDFVITTDSQVKATDCELGNTCVDRVPTFSYISEFEAKENNKMKEGFGIVSYKDEDERAYNENLGFDDKSSTGNELKSISTANGHDQDAAFSYERQAKESNPDEQNDSCDAFSVVDFKPMQMDEQPIITRENTTKLGIYEDDVLHAMLSHLDETVGLSYLRNPFSTRDISVACPSDTMVGVWDHFRGFYDRRRIVPHGKGKLMTTEDKIIYLGEFKNGKRSGFGTGLIVDTSIGLHYGVGYYQGQWQNNCRHGTGCMKLVSGLQYDGAWYLDRPHGMGFLKYPDGSILKGHFTGGLHQGGFQYFAADGHVELRDYDNGHLVATRPFRSLVMEEVRKTPKIDGFERYISKREESLHEEEPNDLSKLKRKEGGIRSLQDIIIEAEKIVDKGSGGSDKSSESQITSSSQKKETPGSGEDFGDLLKDAILTREAADGLIENRSLTKEIDFDDLLENIVHTLKNENQFFMKQNLSAVKHCCEEMLIEAQKNLCEITTTHKCRVEKMHEMVGEGEHMAKMNSKLDALTSKFDGILELCRSMLDRQEEVEKRISALDVHVVDIGESSKAECDSLRKAIKEKENQLNNAENLNNCQVCQENRQDCVLMPCMHMQTCARCIARMRGHQIGTVKCPICRTNIQGEIHLKLS